MHSSHRYRFFFAPHYSTFGAVVCGYSLAPTWLVPLPLWLLAGTIALGHQLAPLSVAIGWLAFGIKD